MSRPAIYKKVELECKCGAKYQTTEKRLMDGRGRFCSKKCMYKYVVKKKYSKYTKKVENSGWFKKGEVSWCKGTVGVVKSWNKGLKTGIKGRSGETVFKKGQQAWNKGKTHLTEENHPNWKGDTVGYGAIHSWVSRKLGTPKKCERCSDTQSKRFHWHNKSRRYLRDVLDWERLCPKCHMQEHKNWEKRWGKK